MGEFTERVRARLAARFGPDFEDLRGQLPKHPEWGETNYYTYNTRDPASIEGIALHHTGSGTTRGTSWEAIARYHITADQNRGKEAWPAIAYPIGIKTASGRTRVALLLDLEYISYHVGNANDTQMAIVVMGNFNNYDPYGGEIDALRGIIADLDGQFGRPLPVRPHYHFRQTDCPARLAKYIPSLRMSGPDMTPLITRLAGRRLVAYNPAFALQKAAFLEGYTTIMGGEVDALLADGRVYRAQEFIRHADGARAMFYAPVNDWSNVRKVSLERD